jgi:hypothetical protein
MEQEDGTGQTPGRIASRRPGAMETVESEQKAQYRKRECRGGQGGQDDLFPCCTRSRRGDAAPQQT